MKLLLAAVTGCVIALPAFAQLDETLLRQAEAWKPGEAPPPRLLKFPDGKIDLVSACGLSVVGSEVSEYISRIKNPDLLTELLLHSRAEPATLRAAASQLIELKGTQHVAGVRQRGT